LAIWTEIKPGRYEVTLKGISGEQSWVVELRGGKLSTTRR
jgi:hypothetical protein